MADGSSSTTPPHLEPTHAASRVPSRGRANFAGVVAIALVLAAGLVLGVAATGSFPGTTAFLVSAGLALAGVMSGARYLMGVARDPVPVDTVFASSVAIFGVAAGAIMSTLGAFAAVLSTMTFSRGRQIRSFGRVLLPRVRTGQSWLLRDRAPLDLPVVVRDELAGAWRENGRTEHASVAAFARHTLELMTLGAPPALVRAAQEDAIDEIRHTELCFTLARAIDGRAIEPGDFPGAKANASVPRPRIVALATLATGSLIDGALHEGVSARIIAKLARRCERPEIAFVLREIARDEGRHAAHGWDVVLWCVEQGGAPIVAALRGALAALPDDMRTSLPERARGGEWERYGIMGHLLEAEEYARTRRDLGRRLEEVGRGSSVAA